MKMNRRFFISLITYLFLFVNSYSQEKEIPPAADRAAKLTEWMKTNLQLTAEQVSPVQEINLKYANKMDDLRKSSQGRRAKLQTLKSDNKAKDAELKKILTADQFKTYLAKKEEIKKKFKEDMKERKQAG
jgi:SMC interacting uncharacterized protein involved in chromosome segregation